MEEITNNLNQEPEVTTAEVVDIQFRPGQKVYFFAANGFICKAGDSVIIDTARGPEFGNCVGGNHIISIRDVVSPLRPVLRMATAQDLRIVEENRAKEKYAFDTCLKKIDEHELDMQLVSAEYAFDGSKIIFFFTADERVDFRELVKNLATLFHTRIELRQSGVRDKAKMVGGLGICGRPFCCASFLDDFQPVSIKMAKTQNLSLNPTKISGTCGRLMCCLKYEQDAYEDLIRNSPKLESFVDTPEGRGTVVELDLLRQRVKVRMEDRPEVIGSFANAEIAVLRNGKAKKTDAPIPADLAPISGQGKRTVNLQEEESPILDPIRFRYSTEAIVEEPVQELPEELPEEVSEKNRRRRTRKGKGSTSAEQSAAVKEEAPAQQDAPAEPNVEPAEVKEPKEHHRNKRHNNHRKHDNKSASKGERPEKAEKTVQENAPVEKPAGEAPAEGEAAAKKRRPNNHYRRRKPKAPGNPGNNQ